MDDAKQELSQIVTLHEGKGIFTYTPVENKRKAVAEVEYSGKKYRFDLPAGLPQGVVMEVDNLSHPDSIGITLRKNGNTPAGVLGLVVLTGGTFQSYSIINFADNKKEISFQIDKTQFPAGVSQVVLFNGKGDILCDRLIFTGGNVDYLDIRAKTDKPSYKPYESVDMEISITNNQANPVNTTFSLSVRDGTNEVEYKHNILTDLLLMSEIKGYVRNPSWYFEEDDDTHRAALDLLLMVQGWRRYSWNRMAGIEPFELQNLPEQGIETSGQIVSMVRGIPKPDVKVDMLLQQRGEEEEQANIFIESFVTDKQGRFSFVSDLDGKWNMILTVSEKGKKTDHRILLDRLFSPEPKRYRYVDMQVNIADNTLTITDEEAEDELEDDFESFFVAYQDSLLKTGITDKDQQLPEVTITAKRNTKEQNIRHHRSTSIAYYDVASELDNIYDSGKYIGDDIHQMLINTNDEFYIRHLGQNEFLFYKGKRVLFVVNYERVDFSTNINIGFFKYKTIKVQAVKSIYINENPSYMAQYIFHPMVSPIAIAESFSCVVFIETYPDGQIPVEGAKGVRKTWLEGYNAVKEFYSPNYSILSPEPDYRRTLYWNPSVTTDENGIAKINFYNNSSCRNFSISAEAVTSQGMIGVYKDR